MRASNVLNAVATIFRTGRHRTTSAAFADWGGALPRASYRRGGGRSKGRGFATSFDFLSAEISGVVSGEVSPDPSTPTPYTYSLPPTPSSDVGDVGGEAAPGSPPDSCLFTSCKKPAAALRSAAETKKNIRARGGWRRMRYWGDEGAPRPLTLAQLLVRARAVRYRRLNPNINISTIQTSLQRNAWQSSVPRITNP